VLLGLVSISLVWLAGSCADGERSRSALPTPADRGVTLEAELHHEGLIVLRSPSFR